MAREQAVHGGPVNADVALLSLIALVIVMPFEPLQPVVSVGWQQVTSVELTLLCGAALWSASLAWSRTWPQWRTPLTTPWLAVLAVLLISAALGGAHRGDALKVVARLSSGFLIFLMAINAITSRSRLHVLMAVAVATGAVVGAIAILEFRGVPAILGWLNQYRDGVRVVGGQVRSGATLQYPTIAAMYFEIVFALGVGLLLSAWDGAVSTRTRWLRSAAIGALLFVIGEGLSLTFTRAGLVGAAASVTAMALWRYARRGLDGGVWLAAAVALFVVTLPVWTWSSEAVRLRLSSEGRQGWYAPRSLRRRRSRCRRAKTRSSISASPTPVA
jgi:hypothetical protein